MRLVRLACLLAALGCSACSVMAAGCPPGGLNYDANPCNAENAKVGAFSTVPYDGWR